MSTHYPRRSAITLIARFMGPSWGLTTQISIRIPESASLPLRNHTTALVYVKQADWMWVAAKRYILGTCNVNATKYGATQACVCLSGYTFVLSTYTYYSSGLVCVDRPFQAAGWRPSLGFNPSDWHSKAQRRLGAIQVVFEPRRINVSW